MTACQMGYLNEVKLLLDGGADFNIADQVGLIKVLLPPGSRGG